jgi:outer membrane protein assembly factor BamB
MTHRKFPLCALLVAILGVAAALRAATVEPFWFVHISDTHIGAPNADELLSATLVDIQKQFPQTEFVVNTGDLTEMGRDDQLTTYMQLIRSWPWPVYNTVGNHDARWSETGKSKFREMVGPTRFTFEHKGVHFFFVDISVLAEHHGHFNKDDLAWLDAELGRLAPDAPAVVCVHHAPLAPGSTIDNDTEFGNLIARYNVPLVLVGHGHSFYRYTFNGTTYAMGASTSIVAKLGVPCYRAFYVDTKGFWPYLRMVARDKTTSETMIPLQKSGDPYGALTVESKERIRTEKVRLDCRLTSIGRARLTTGTLELDKAFRGTFRFERRGRFSVDSPSTAPGTHRLTITFVDDRKSTWCRSTLFDVPNPRGRVKGPELARRFEMPSTIQSSPAVYRNLMFAGCNDGTLRAFDLLSGNVVWEQKLGGEVFSSPAVENGLLVVGCNDFSVYCFDAYTGLQRWKFPTGAAVMASPLIVGDTVYVGSGDARMYALDLATGRLHWSFAAERMIKCRPACANGKLFFGAWDNWFYCVNAKDGRLVWKVPVSTTAQFSLATANPATTGSRVVFTSHDYCTRCLDQKTGSHLWSYRPSQNELGPSYSSFVFYGNAAYGTAISGRVMGFDLLSGRKIVDIPVRPLVADELFDSLPVLDGDYLYVGSTGGNIYCVNLAARRVEWSYALQPGFIFTTPALWGDRLLVASSSGTIFEIRRPEATGRLPFPRPPRLVPPIKPITISGLRQ